MTAIRKGSYDLDPDAVRVGQVEAQEYTADWPDSGSPLAATQWREGFAHGWAARNQRDREPEAGSIVRIVYEAHAARLRRRLEMIVRRTASESPICWEMIGSSNMTTWGDLINGAAAWERLVPARADVTDGRLEE